MKMSDERIVVRSLTDPETFAALVDRHGADLYRYIARRAPDAVEDLLSEAWLVAFRRRDSYDPAQGDVRGWLFGIARMTVISHYRKSRIDFSRFLALVDRDGEEMWDEVDARLDAAAVAPLLRTSLAELPEVERELLLLNAWEGLSPTEAAAVLGIPAGTARSRLHRARRRLQTALSDCSWETGQSAGGEHHG